jgi:O-antigen/teichoic acid export membrane protein
MGDTQRPFAKRLLGFVGLPFLSLIAPFVLLPLIARIGGADSWAAVAIGQSVGAFAAVCITFGWGLTGPAEVAPLQDAAQRVYIYRLSFAGRSVLFVIVAPIACLVAAVLAPAGHEVEAIAMASALALGGLSPAWYCVGIGRPSLIAAYEVAPRLVATAIAAVIVMTTHAIYLYPVVMTCATIGGLLVFNRQHGELKLGGFPLRLGVKALIERKAGAATGLVSGVYSSTPVAIVSGVSDTLSVATFASGDKLYRIGLYAAIAVSNAFQGWVAEVGKGERRRRMKVAVLSHTGLGLVGMLGLGILGPWFSALLFGSEVAATSAVCWGYGAAFLAVSLNSALGKHVLVPLGRTRVVFWSTVVGASIGVPALAVLATLMGGAGGAWGLALGEWAVCLFQAVVLVRILTKGTGRRRAC